MRTIYFAPIMSQNTCQGIFRKRRGKMEKGPMVSREKNYATLQIIWLSMVVSVVIYFFVARYVLADPGFGPQVPVGVIAITFVILSAALLMAQLLLRTLLSDDKLFPRFREEKTTGSPETFIGGDAGARFLLQNHMTFSLILWALGEAPAIFGLVLTFLSSDMRYLTGFGLYSIVNLFFFRPRRGQYEEQLVRLRRYLAGRKE